MGKLKQASMMLGLLPSVHGCEAHMASDPNGPHRGHTAHTGVSDWTGTKSLVSTGSLRTFQVKGPIRLSLTCLAQGTDLRTPRTQKVPPEKPWLPHRLSGWGIQGRDKDRREGTGSQTGRELKQLHTLSTKICISQGCSEI